MQYNAMRKVRSRAAQQKTNIVCLMAYRKSDTHAATHEHSMKTMHTVNLCILCLAVSTSRFWRVGNSEPLLPVSWKGLCIMGDGLCEAMTFYERVLYDRCTHFGMEYILEIGEIMNMYMVRWSNRSHFTKYIL